MKKLLFLVTVAALTICLLTSCGGGVKTYTDSGQTINVSVDQEFIIALESNPTTGYSWQASYDETALELVGGESTYEPGEASQEDLVGAGGTESFRFKALKAGETDITMVYKRSWEEYFAEQKVFTVDIK